MTRGFVIVALAALLALAASTPADSRQGALGRGFSKLGAAIKGGTYTPPVSGCANQMVLDYSNSCALIAQAWGQ